LVAGVILGPSLLGLLNPADSVIVALGELGVLILLFQIGLHTDLKSILKVGAAATTVGLIGVALPFGLGLLVTHALGVTGIPAVVCSAALTATSVGISARVLSDLGELDTIEGRIVIGAAVLDDVVGLIILSVVAGLVGGAGLSLGGVAKVSSIAVGFIVLAIAVGQVVVPPLIRLASRIKVGGALGALALALALGMAGLADAAGSAMIIGAFAAGLILHATPERHEVEHATTPLGHFFVPIFFAGIGAAMNLQSLADSRVLAIGGALLAVGVVGKLAAGVAPWWIKGRRTLIGVAMIPRGEVGLIFAQMGLATGALDAGLFSAVLLMVMATTFIAPPWLALLARRRPGPGGPPADPGPGLDDLVSGNR
jgi:Kef-type K+ transport system membrane component KefB